MAIEQSKTEHYTKTVASFTGQYKTEVYPFRVSCDYCGKAAFKSGDDAGLAADEARRDGFTTIRAKSVALPSKWICKDCSAKKE